MTGCPLYGKYTLFTSPPKRVPLPPAAKMAENFISVIALTLLIDCICRLDPPAFRKRPGKR